MTLDLNGHTIKFTRTVKETPKSFSLKGNSAILNGSIEASLYGEGGGTIYAEQGSNATLKDITVTARCGEKPAYAAVVYGGYMDDPNGNMVIESGTFNGYVGTNGSTRGGSLTINGGTFNEFVYLPAYMNYTINGGTFNKGIEFDSGIIEINGGTFYKGEEDYSVLLVAHNGPIDNSHDSGYGPTPELTVNGGTIEGPIGLQKEKTESEYAYPTVTKAAGVTVETVEI